MHPLPTPGVVTDMVDIKNCVHCGEEFELKPNKPGKINECPSCAKDVPKIKAATSWDDKHTPRLNMGTDEQVEKTALMGTRRGGMGKLNVFDEVNIINEE